jgi:bacterioferritin
MLELFFVAPGRAGAMKPEDKDQVVDVLNRILEQELAGLIRYTHYAFMVFGPSRIPIVSWFRSQAAEALAHAEQAGELITHLGAYPSLGIGPLLDTHKTDIMTMLRESLTAEQESLKLYRRLLKLVEGRSVMIEEYARQMIYAEEMHASEVEKMLRKPGEVAVAEVKAGR